MKTVIIDGAAIMDEASLHREFSAKMGFPGFYGHNWDAWIDCMGYITEPDAGMTKVHVAVREELLFRVLDGRALEQRCPDLVKVLLECGNLANERLQNHGGGAQIRLLLDDAAQQGVAPDPSTLRSRLTRRFAAEARWAGQAAQLPKLSVRFDGWRSGWWRAADAWPLGGRME